MCDRLVSARFKNSGGKLTQDDILKKHKDIVERRKKLNMKMKKLMLEWQQLQLECDHPHGYQTSTMGELGTRCPDCGHST